MKKLIASIVISMVLLTGCLGIDQDAISLESHNDIEQEYFNISSDLMVELEKIGVVFDREAGEDSPLVNFSYEDEYGRVSFLLADLVASDDRRLNRIIIESQQDLSQHPVVRAFANVGGDEVISWLAKQEKQLIETKQEKTIQDLLVLDSNYLYFEYFPGGEIRTLEIEWSVRPQLPIEFEEIAHNLAEDGLLTTGYIEGVGGYSLIATNPDYYFLEKRRYQRDREIDIDMGQAATYKVRGDKAGNYSVQLYGYMEWDSDYKTKVEEMPGLGDIVELMNMDQEDFFAMTGKVNEELTKAKEILNDNLQREYYLEGDLGEYHYTLMVPGGIGMYNFTVLIERE